MTGELEPYDDGRWTVADHPPGSAGPLWCRGNSGEVFPNVMTPLTNSLYLAAVGRGQVRAVHEFGMATARQVAEFGEHHAWGTGIFGGYLYANVTLARTAAASAPGLTVEMVDEQMFGLHGAPAHRHEPGERDLRATGKMLRFTLGALRRVDGRPLHDAQTDIARYVAGVGDIGSSSNEELLAVARSIDPWADRMMYRLLMASAPAGIARSLLERLVAALGEPGLENRLTAGLGTIESAEPASELWRLGRLVAGDATLATVFDAGLDGLDARLRSAGSARSAGGATSTFVAAFDAFRDRHRARGPDEWELASPTWESDPAIGLAMIDRLRRAPDERDPVVVGHALATTRDVLATDVRRRLRQPKRAMFERALRAVIEHSAQREATKAAFMRAMYPARQALAELARRSGLAHHDFFLLRVDEVAGALRDTAALAATIAERRVRRDYLQARVPPFWFEGVLPPPSTWEWRAAIRRPDAAARQITGMGVCSGVATGTARIVTDPTAPGELGPDDILVAPLTDPAWTPLFLAAAGVVVDVGAQQSHAAIVARELGIPAVVSATGASRTIPDGARITVDGSTGVVTVHAP